jgi:hypothetical protein
MQVQQQLSAEANDQHWQQWFSGQQQDLSQWLQLQCSLLPACQQALLVIDDGDQFQPVALWPNEQLQFDLLSTVVEQVIEQNQGVVSPLIEQSNVYVLGYPLMVNNALHGVLVLLIKTDNEKGLAGVKQQVEWGSGWLLRHFYQRQNSDINRKQLQLSNSVSLLSTLLAQDNYDSAATTLVAELASANQCELAAFGEYRNEQITLSHLSHSAEFSERMNLVRAIEQAMEESIDQRAKLIWPAPEGEQNMAYGQLALAQQKLSALFNGSSVITLPLYRGQKVFAALCLIRPAQHTFSAEDGLLLEASTALASQSLSDKQLADRSLWQTALERGRVQLGKLFGKNYIGRKIIVLLLLGLSLFLAFAQGQYNLSADATLQPVTRQLLVAPFDGYVQRAAVRAGDNRTR